MYIIIQMFWVNKIFILFFKRSLLCSLSLHFFDLKYHENSNVVKYYYNLKRLFSILIFFKMQFIPVMAKLNFQHHYSSLNCHFWSIYWQNKILIYFKKTYSKLLNGGVYQIKFDDQENIIVNFSIHSSLAGVAKIIQQDQHEPSSATMSGFVEGQCPRTLDSHLDTWRTENELTTRVMS